jgi:anti-anti-sigma factor
MSTGFAPSPLPSSVGLPRVVYIRGEHDRSTVEALSMEFATAFDDGESPVIVDLSEVTFMDTSTLQLLQRTRDYLAESNRSFVVRRPSRSARRLLSVCDAISPSGLTIDLEWPHDPSAAHDLFDDVDNGS